MQHLTTARRLLECLHAESAAVCDDVASAAGLSLDRAHAARIGSVRLTLSEQLRLSEAAAVLAPDFTPHALRLRGLVLSARSVDMSEALERRHDPATEAWERAAELHS
ncbi:MAG: hypothetical protein ACREPM_13220 [Gemmatimonadaceae bacterium]